MKLVVSNIAWTKEEEPAVARLLQNLGVKYIEVAPTKLWEDPTQVSDQEIGAYKKFWQEHGIEIVAFQSMLFNRPDLKIFEGEELRRQTFDYLTEFIGLAPKFGAGAMVFGSPKNRQKGDTPLDEAGEIAKDFFSRLGDVATANNTVFCVEPNPEAYACDFIVNAEQGIELVKAVNNPGFGLHLDIAGMTLAGDDITESIHNAAPLLKHLHISAPFLGPVEEDNGVQYQAAAQALYDINYDRFVSIEMKPEATGNETRVEKAVRFAQKTF